MKKYVLSIIGAVLLAGGSLRAGDVVALGSGTSNALNELVLFDATTGNEFKRDQRDHVRRTGRHAIDARIQCD